MAGSGGASAAGGAGAGVVDPGGASGGCSCTIDDATGRGALGLPSAALGALAWLFARRRRGGPRRRG